MVTFDAARIYESWPIRVVCSCERWLNAVEQTLNQVLVDFKVLESRRRKAFGAGDLEQVDEGFDSFDLAKKHPPWAIGMLPVSEQLSCDVRCATIAGVAPALHVL